MNFKGYINTGVYPRNFPRLTLQIIIYIYIVNNYNKYINGIKIYKVMLAQLLAGNTFM